MPTYSQITIKFLRDYEEPNTFDIVIDDNGNVSNNLWTFVATRTGAFEIEEGTPTGNVGETTAINFKTAFDLDLPTGYVTTVQNTNEILIQSETVGLNFVGFKSKEGDFAGAASYIEGVDYNVTFDNVEDPVDISNVEFILTRSPHYINTPFNVDSTTAINLDVYIWSGDLTAQPTQPTYTLNKVRPSVDFLEDNTNISQLVRESLEATPNITLSATPSIVNSEPNEVKWVVYDVTYIDSESTIPNETGTLIGTDGFGLYNEGVNPTKPSDNILTSCKLRKAERSGFVLLPFVNNGVITSIDVLSNNGEISNNVVVTPSNISTDAVQYLQVDLSQTTNDTQLTVTFNPSGEQVVYQIEDECRYDPKFVVFRNRYGVYECCTFFKKSTESLNVSNETFTNNYINAGVYDTTYHQFQKINIQGKENISLNSGYISEQENALYKEMLLSEKVYFYENGNLVPVNVASKSIEFKTRVNDRLVNYSVDFEYAYNTIQNV